MTGSAARSQDAGHSAATMHIEDALALHVPARGLTIKPRASFQRISFAQLFIHPGAASIGAVDRKCASEGVTIHLEDVAGRWVAGTVDAKIGGLLASAA